MKGWIYKYTYANGKVYIGQTRNSTGGVKERHYQHMGASRDPSRANLCEVAIAKYGEPELEVIEEIEVDDSNPTLLVEKLNDAEKKWIAEYDSTDKSKGYNIKNGGEQCTPKQFLLEEEWYRIFTKEHWGEKLAYIKYILESIYHKKFFTHEKFSDEEYRIWYRYKFIDNDTGRETTFSQYYKDYKDIDALILLEGGTEEEIEEQTSDREIFISLIQGKAFESFVEDVRQTIWKKVMRRESSLLVIDGIDWGRNEK